MHTKTKRQSELNDTQLGMPGSGPLHSRKRARQTPAQERAVLLEVHSAHPGDAGSRPCRARGPQAPVGCSLAGVQGVQDGSGGS